MLRQVAQSFILLLLVVPADIQPSVSQSLATINHQVSVNDRPVQSEQEDDIREAVFRQQFADYEKNNLHPAGNYYLRIGKKGDDPSTKFLRRFKGHRPKVRKGSQATYSGVDAVDGIIFNIYAIEWINDKEALVFGSRYEGDIVVPDLRYNVTKESGKWVVRSAGLM